ncbi:hypothetical protein ACP4OV_022700 [Aristida adscensionis]
MAMAMAARLQLLLPITPPTPSSCRPPRVSARPPPARPRRPPALPIPAAAATTGGAQSTPASGKLTLKLTYLEINSWVWEVQRQDAQAPPLRILVDPILVGNLDFGAPWLFDGAKRDPHVRALSVDDLLAADLDLLLITQSLDDHCHARTLTQLAARAPDLPVVTTPNARPALAALPAPFRRVTFLEPGQSAALAGGALGVLATAGPVLGPPWQRPENGYILTAGGGGVLYYEPHCVYDAAFVEERRLRAEVVITPVVKQLLPAGFTLVSGQEEAVGLARRLGARYVVPMSNGDVDAGGILASVLATEGTTHSFKAMLAEALPEAQVLDPTPGVPLQIQLDLETSDGQQPQAAAA